MKSEHEERLYRILNDIEKDLGPDQSHLVFWLNTFILAVASHDLTGVTKAFATVARRLCKEMDWDWDIITAHSQLLNDTTLNILEEANRDDK